MLNLHDIKIRIAQPALCGNEDIVQLKELCEAFPYTQIYPILYLKALALTNDVRFENALQEYAFRIADRQQLFNLLHEKDTSPIHSTEFVSTEKNSNNQEDLELKKSDIPSFETLITNKGESQPKELESPIETKTEEEINGSHEDDWEEEIDTAITLNITTKGTEIEPSENRFETSSSNESNWEQKEADSSHFDEDTYERELLAEVISASYNLDHLELNEAPQADATGEKALPIEKVEDPIDTSNESKRSFSSWLKSNEHHTNAKIDDEKNHIDELVNRFIDNEPRISRTSTKEIIERPKKSFFSPTQVAKESIDVQVMPVSETLAKIFAIQGNFPKAIFAYEQLILLNPEKKAFFASQIEELKKKITQ